VEERRRASDDLKQLNDNVTALMTRFDENFNRTDGHFTVAFKDLKEKVESHDGDIKFAKGGVAVLAGLWAVGLAWLKTQIGAAK
jgi:hypothetical protein